MSLKYFFGLANVRFLPNHEFLKKIAPAKLIVTATLLFLSIVGFSQNQASSENGWKLSPHDTLRVLVVFAEIDFDVDKHLNPHPESGKFWPAGQLPLYKDSLFDPFSAEETTAPISKYYYQMSLGNFTLLGDYVDHLISIPYSLLNSKSEGAFRLAVIDSLNATDNLKTGNGLQVSDFDLWLNENESGLPKEKNTTDSYQGIDHLMFIVRNHPSTPGSSGRASSASVGEIYGKRTDSYSWMGGFTYPFYILKHEFSHLLVGGNNFHAGGGNEAHFSSYFLPQQSGWSLMGGYEQSLMTCNGWDRNWLGWKAPGKNYLISALSIDGTEISTDLDAEDTTSAGVYILRDFVSTGDVMRLKLPFIPDSTFQQYLWIENHTTSTMDGGQFDNYIYSNYACMEKAVPGLYMQVQVEKDEKSGKGIYGGKADFLRAVPANGNYDLSWKSDVVDNGWCVGRVNAIPFFKQPFLENALTGSQDQEWVFIAGQDDRSLHENNMFRPTIWQTGDSTFKYNTYLGLTAHAFTLQGNSKISIATNPSTASMLTLVNHRTPPRGKEEENNRIVYLNGLSIEILEEYSSGAIKVRIKLDDTMLDEDRRWCAPQLVLPDIPGADVDLDVKAHVILDHGLTATRLDSPDIFMNKPVFTSPTHFKIYPNAVLRILPKGKVSLINESQLTILADAKLSMKETSQLVLKDGSKLHFALGSEADINKKARIKLRGDSRIYCMDKNLLRILKKAARPASKVVFEER